MRESVLLAAMALSMIGCPYRGIGDSDADLAGLEDHDMQCKDTIMLNLDTGNANIDMANSNIDMANSNQGNGDRCSLGTNGEVKWSNANGSNASGSCQYVVGFNLGDSIPCSSNPYYFQYDALASWVGGSPVNVSGAAVRIFVRDTNGKLLGSKSASLEINIKKSQCIQLSARPSSLGGISALLVLTLDTSNWLADLGVPLADLGVPLPSVRISDAKLTTSHTNTATCVSLDPL